MFINTKKFIPAMVLLVITGVAVGLLAGAAASSQGPDNPHPVEVLLPGYWRTDGGDLIDSHAQAWDIQSRVRNVFPYTWGDTLRSDKELEAWLEKTVADKTTNALLMGVTGFADRQAYWEDAVKDIQYEYTRKVSDKYSLVAATETTEE